MNKKSLLFFPILLGMLMFATKGNALTVYRNYNAQTGEHLYTFSRYEWNQLPKISYYWNQDGVVFDEPASGKAVYRLYNPGSGQHLFTADSYEYKVVQTQGWKSEGIAFYSGGKIPVYRLYNPHSGQHLDTANGTERNSLVKAGWRAEGTAWYAESQGGVAVPPKPKAPDTPIPPHAKAPQYFSQLDGRWANVRFGNYPVSSAGCGPTSLAMILKGSYGLNVDPGTVALRANQMFAGQLPYGILDKQILAVSNAYGHAASYVKSEAEAIQYLKAGYPLIFDIYVGVGHDVVAYGYDDGKTTVYDPYGHQFFSMAPTSLSKLYSILNGPYVAPDSQSSCVLLIK